MDLFRKKDPRASSEGLTLQRCLSGFDLTLLGIGAVIGAGVFVLTGVVAATQAGPAIVFSYVLAGLACVFAALSYAELAAMIGGCGSAYGYAYAGFGELLAWIVGWDLLLEYTVSVSAVSVGWSAYVGDVFSSLALHFPKTLLHGPSEGGIVNIMALFVIFTLTGLLSVGMRSSTRFNHVMVLTKLSVIAMVIVVTGLAFQQKNWVPFAPFGLNGVIDGAALIFFAYVGFDAVATTAEEVINPQRNLPIGIIGSLFICTVIYIIVAACLTGAVPYHLLNVASPISHALLLLGHPAVAAIVGLGAIAGLTTVMLVLFYGLSRVFLAMSRDGLLPAYFSKVNARTHTPIRILVTCGVIMSLIAGWVPIGELAELVNVGTLFAFAVVCAGVIILRHTQPDAERPFKTPGAPLVPLLGIISCVYLMVNLPWVTLLRFIVWMAIGMIVYFGFSRSNSALAPQNLTVDEH
ncbi:MAG: amino acid permease [Gammaproteobacteria bacterium]|nr:amino acid permease [Gammaproteobacteria bacterium]